MPYYCKPASNQYFMPDEHKFPLIPDIRKQGELLPQILEGNVIVFVGNGVSRLAGVPSWRELALTYLKDWLKAGNLSYDAYDKLKREKSPLQLLTICAGKLGKEELKKQLYGRLTEHIKEDSEEEKRILRIYGYIRDFHAGYVTTNYDHYLEKSHPTRDVENVSEESAYSQNLSDKLTRLNLDDDMEMHQDRIVYLHGKAIDPKAGDDGEICNNIILTLEDYLEHYKDDGGRGKYFLGNVFEKHIFLFIGFGLTEMEIIQHIKRPDNSYGHYILLGVSDYEYDIREQYEDYYRILNITPIFYSISKKGYDQLEEVLQKWSLDIRAARREQEEKLRSAEKDINNLRQMKEVGNGTFR